MWYVRYWCCFVSVYGKEVRRRVWRVVGVEVGLLHHDGEVEGVVVKDDIRFWNSASVCSGACPKTTK